MIRVNSRYNRVWIVGRTYLRGPQDLGNVHRIQNEYSITPLSKFGTAYKPPRPRKIITKSTDATIPGTQPGEDPLAFYAALGKEMLKFPAPAADRPLLAQAQGGRHRPRAQSRERAPQRRHAPRPARRGHARAQQGPVRRAGALPPGIRQAQRLPRSPISARGARTTPCARSATSSASAASGRASRPTRSRCSTTPRRRSQDRSGTSCTSRRAACRSR